MIERENIIKQENNMIDEGSLVCSTYVGKLQMGTVSSRRVGDDKWAYYTVEWHDNDKYEAIQKGYRELNPNGVYGRTEYRAGEIFEVSPDQVTKLVNEHLDFLYSSFIPKDVVNG
tara:strand:- start:281 stop:625 length:345 start_codon:yes stop_codon:yes gene_type:complete